MKFQFGKSASKTEPETEFKLYTNLWSAMVEFRDQSLICICPIDQDEKDKIEAEKSKRAEELSASFQKLETTIKEDMSAYPENLKTIAAQILKFAPTILDTASLKQSYQNLCQHYQTFHQLTLDLNKLIKTKYK